MPEADRERYMRRRRALEEARQSWFDHWKEVSQYVQPRLGQFLRGPDRNRGSKKHQNIINNTATRALGTLAAGLMAGISSPARPWFRLRTGDPDLDELGPVKQWLGIVERRMRDVFSGSNFYNAIHQLYVEEGAFGTGVLLILEDREDVIRCLTLTAGEFMLATDERLVINTLYRDCTRTVHQLVARFGYDNCSPHVQNLHNRGQVDELIDIVHLVEPRALYDSGNPRATEMPWRSVYFETSREARDQVLSESGFQEFPAACPRWEVTGNEVYGASPAMESLGDTKQLQMQERRKAQAVDKMSNPPLVGPPSLKQAAVQSLPGGITYLDSQSAGARLEPLYQVEPRIRELYEDISQTERRIRESYFADLFQMMTLSDRRQITAREVEEKHEEKLLMLGPVLERQHNELLDVVIDRTFAIMSRNGLIPRPPPDLEGLPLNVEYVSILAQAQKAVGTSSIDRLATYALGVAQANPDVLDKVDWDQTIDEYGDALGVPVKTIRPDEDVAKMRQVRAQQEQMAQAMAVAQQGADTAKSLSQAETENDNLLSQLTGG